MRVVGGSVGAEKRAKLCGLSSVDVRAFPKKPLEMKNAVVLLLGFDA